MGTRDIQPHSSDRGHEQDAGIVASRTVEPLDDLVPLLHAVVPIQRLNLDARSSEHLDTEHD